MSSPTLKSERPRIGWKPYSPHASTWRERFWDPSDSASVRVRCLAPCDALAAAGWSSELFSPDRAHRYDLVVFQKAYDEDSLRLAQELKRRGVRLVLDICDNHLYNPAARTHLAARAERLLRMLEIVDAASVSTPALADALPDVHQPVLRVDDALDPLLKEAAGVDGGGRLPAALPRQREERLRVVWFGMQTSDLDLVGQELAVIHSELPLQLTAIGNSRRSARGFGRRSGVPVRFRGWRQNSFARALREHHVAIIPVAKNPFTAVKTSNRVVTSLLLGIPAVVSQIPSYEEFSGCVLVEDFTHNVLRYARDRDLAAAHVECGRALIRSRYTREHLVDQWSKVFEAALDQG